MLTYLPFFKIGTHRWLPAAYYQQRQVQPLPQRDSNHIGHPKTSNLAPCPPHICNNRNIRQRRVHRVNQQDARTYQTRYHANLRPHCRPNSQQGNG